MASNSTTRIAFRIVYVIAEDGCPSRKLPERPREDVAAPEDVVAQDQGHRVAANERVGNSEGLGDSFGTGLFPIPSICTPKREPSPSNWRKRGRSCVVEIRYMFLDAAFDQGRERIIDHRLVIERAATAWTPPAVKGYSREPAPPARMMPFMCPRTPRQRANGGNGSRFSPASGTEALSPTDAAATNGRAAMNSLVTELTGRLDALTAAGLRRELRRVDSAPGREIEIGGRRLINFSTNDYLGLASHPALIEAATRAAREFGAGSGASRLICGSVAPHHELEEALAVWKETPAALTFSSGFAAALGVIPALVGRDDVVVLDKLVHACCVDAARLSGATLRVFRHNNLEHLAEILTWARKHPNSGKQRILIVTESVFSMDGDCAPLAALVELKERFDAWLMLDEAHAVGLFGARRSGLAEAEGVGGRIEVQMGTLGKQRSARRRVISAARERWWIIS